MSKRAHFRISGRAVSEPYSLIPATGSSRVSLPTVNRLKHAQKLRGQIERVVSIHQEELRESGASDEGLCLEVTGATDCPLPIAQLENRTSKIEVLSTHRIADREIATLYLPPTKSDSLLKKIEDFEESPSDARARNRKLLGPIDKFSTPDLLSFWCDKASLFPSNEDESIFWEVWIRVPNGQEPEIVFQEFRGLATSAGLNVQHRNVVFQDRLVCIAYGTSKTWGNLRAFLQKGGLAELRRARTLATELLDLDANAQAEFSNELVQLIGDPPEHAAAICILDKGISHAHPLVAPFVAENGIHSINDDWGTADADDHGTMMASVALYGAELADLMVSQIPIGTPVKIESVKIIDSNHDGHAVPVWGSVTTEALARAESGSPHRSRVACLAVSGEGHISGNPSSWSAAIDQHAAGELDSIRRLYVVSVGNIRDCHEPHLYPQINLSEDGAIEDPGQSWNALTVGAYTEFAALEDGELDREVVAAAGGLSPRSRTSCGWDTTDNAPNKPDVVAEGGNYVTDEVGGLQWSHSLSILCAKVNEQTGLLGSTRDTSPATAMVAGLAAEIMTWNPELWPETVRALVVHSAEWTDHMISETRTNKTQRLRRYGYGVPSRERALWTLQNDVSLIAEETIQPYSLNGSDAVMNESHFHDLPWPEAALSELGDEPIEIRITLSYFPEPSPGGRGWNNKFRYPAFGLKFTMRGPDEDDEMLRRRVNASNWTEAERSGDEDRPTTSEPIKWEVGTVSRARGSICSDIWRGPAIEAARMGKIIVFPTKGWWFLRKHLRRVESQTRYSLVVSIRTEDQEVDLATPIATAIGIEIDI